MVGLLICSPAFAATIHVNDGDTFTLDGERIRIENIDAPEMQGKCDAERRLAKVTKRELERILAAGSVEMHRATRKDQYGRTIARVSVGGKDVGQTLIALDLARPWRGKREPWCN
jgi:endonuclease YncB( thermonuclease family)